MPLHKIKDFDPDYRSQFGDQDVLGYDLYSGNDKVGSIHDLLVDDAGKFRYMVINTGAWIFGKKVLLPVGRARISHSDRRIYVDGLSREQVEALPDYDENQIVDYDYEERTRGVYRPTVGATGMAPTDATTPVDATSSVDTTPVDTTPYDRNTYNYDRDAALYNMNDRDHATLRLYEERLTTNKTREKTGEVALGKHVETETQHVSVPVEKERVVVERSTPADAGTVVTPGTDAFQEGETVRMELYEETPDIRKETVVREDVQVRKEVDRENVEVDETLRREELDMDKQGRSIEERNRPGTPR